MFLKTNTHSPHFLSGASWSTIKENKFGFLPASKSCQDNATTTKNPDTRAQNLRVAEEQRQKMRQILAEAAGLGEDAASPAVAKKPAAASSSVHVKAEPASTSVRVKTEPAAASSSVHVKAEPTVEELSKQLKELDFKLEMQERRYFQLEDDWRQLMEENKELRKRQHPYRGRIPECHTDPIERGDSDAFRSFFCV